MKEAYPFLGRNQPKNQSRTGYQVLGSLAAMAADEINKSEFGLRVRRRRKAMQFSQPYLARITGISQQNITSIETGKVERTGRIIELASALWTTPEWLYFGQGQEEVAPEDPAATINDLLHNLNRQEQLDVLREVQRRANSLSEAKTVDKRKRATR